MFVAIQVHSVSTPTIELFLRLIVFSIHLLSEEAVARITPEFCPSTSPVAEHVRVDKGLHPPKQPVASRLDGKLGFVEFTLQQEMGRSDPNCELSTNRFYRKDKNHIIHYICPIIPLQRSHSLLVFEDRLLLLFVSLNAFDS